MNPSGSGMLSELRSRGVAFALGSTTAVAIFTMGVLNRNLPFIVAGVVLFGASILVAVTATMAGRLSADRNVRDASASIITFVGFLVGFACKREPEKSGLTFNPYTQWIVAVSTITFIVLVAFVTGLVNNFISAQPIDSPHSVSPLEQSPDLAGATATPSTQVTGTPVPSQDADLATQGKQASPVENNRKAIKATEPEKFGTLQVMSGGNHPIVVAVDGKVYDWKKPITLPIGKHTVELRNQGTGESTVVPVEIRQGQPVVVTHKTEHSAAGQPQSSPE